MNSVSVINYVTKISFGFGAVGVLRQECERIGIARPLLVTDRGVRAAGLVDRVVEQLGSAAPTAIYEDTPPNPTEAAVRAAAALYREHGCDGIVAVGGGSPIDLAKGVAVCVAHEGPLKSFAAVENGIERITPATAPVVAVPTTAGTGSEVGRGAILIVEDGRKLGILSPYIIPRAAICDPALTLGLPAGLTAATGMDAVSHCVETFLSPLFNPPADGIALDGLRRAWAHIEQATREPGDREARLNMMSASLQGALAFQKGLGCVHSLSHSLGGINPKLHHGTLNAILLPSVVAFNSTAPTAVAEAKMDRLAQAMGLAGGAEVVPAISAMTQRLGLPQRLRDIGVTTDLFPAIVKGALGDHSHRTNPREATEQDYLDLLQQAW